MLTPILKVAAPFAILAGGFAGASWLNATAPTVPTQTPETAIPLVEVRTVEQGPRTIHIHGHATAKVARQVELVAQVQARVDWVSPALEAGAFVAAEAELLRLDDTDYRLAQSSALARLAQAEAALQLEQAEADIAIADWEQHGEGEVPALVAREPQLARARADVQSAQAALDAAQRDLERCVIRAPFAARVEARRVSEGSFVGTGQSLASLVDRGRMELEVPVRMQDLAALELSLGEETRRVPVTATASFGESEASWSGAVVRTAASLDARTRMAKVIAQIDSPYSLEPPLVPGTFVRVSLEGRRVDAAVAIPRSALRDDSTVLVATSQDTLEIRKVETLHFDGDEVILRSGLLAGERLIVTPMVTVVPDMPIRVMDGVAD